MKPPMHPYRTPDRRDDEDEALAAPLEEWLVAGALALIGSARVVLALVSGEVFGTEVTIAAILASMGFVFTAQLAIRSRRLD